MRITRKVEALKVCDKKEGKKIRAYSSWKKTSVDPDILKGQRETNFSVGTSEGRTKTVNGI